MTISVADIDAIQRTPNCPYRRALARWEAAERGTYADFLSVLYPDLDSCINGLRTIVHQVQNDGEDRLTSDLVLQLRCLNYDATHDEQAGGHIDIGIKSGPHTWLGEAKLDAKIDQGLKQLITRYTQISGDPNHDHGGLLFYLIKSDDAKGKLEAWRQELEAMPVPCTDCTLSKLAFFSEHKQPSTGLPFHVRTMAVALHWDPQDPSGIETKARRAAKAANKAAPSKKAAAKKAPKSREAKPQAATAKRAPARKRASS